MILAALVAVLAGAAVALVVLLRALGIFEGTSATTAGDGSFVEVKRGPMTASIVESGTLRSSQSVVVKNELEGRVAVLSIVTEGTHVKAGDLLVELDSSLLVDARIDQEIKVQSIEASFIQARENLEIVRKQAKADTDIANVEHQLAELDLRKYVDGEFRQQIQDMESKIKIAESGLNQKTQTLDASRSLYKDGYLTQTELQADELAHQTAELGLDLARSELDLLQRFTHQRRLAELKSAVGTKAFNVEKAAHKGQAGIVEAQARLIAEETNLKREKSKLGKLIDQIAKTKIHAPCDGMVVYARPEGERWGGNDEPLREGAMVRERQALIELPTTSGMLADIKIHEASLERVSVGLPVRITVDAMPDRVFAGVVEKIALLPDQQNRWLNPDLTVFNTQITVSGDTSVLRPGMSCRAEIVLDEFKDTLFVPIQCVLRIDGKPTVYRADTATPEPVRIEVGLDNGRVIQVRSGLSEGDRVMLNPPMPPSIRPDSASGDVAAEAITDPAASTVAEPPQPQAPSEPAAQERRPDADGARPSGEGQRSRPPRPAS